MIGRVPVTKRLFHAAVSVAVAALVAFLLYQKLRHVPTTLEIMMRTSSGAYAQVFFDTGRGFSERESVWVHLKAPLHAGRVELPRREVLSVRIDPMGVPGTFALYQLKFENKNGSYLANAPEIMRLAKRIHHASCAVEGAAVQGTSLSSNPYIVLEKPEFSTTSSMRQILTIIAAAAGLTIAVVHGVAGVVENVGFFALFVVSVVPFLKFVAVSGSSTVHVAREYRRLLSGTLALPAPERDQHNYSGFFSKEFLEMVSLIKAQTGADSFILVPPQAPPWLGIGNAALARYLIYPRFLENGLPDAAERSFFENGTDIKGRFIVDEERRPDFILFARRDGMGDYPDQLWPPTDVDAEYVVEFDRDTKVARKRFGPYEHRRYLADATVRMGLIKTLK